MSQYLELCSISNKILGPFSINTSGVTTRYLELSISWTFFTVPRRYRELTVYIFLKARLNGKYFFQNYFEIFRNLSKYFDGLNLNFQKYFSDKKSLRIGFQKFIVSEITSKGPTSFERLMDQSYRKCSKKHHLSTKWGSNW